MVSGRENSVAVTFHLQLFQACRDINTIDMNIPLNGADRHFNADHIFSSNEQFLLIEFKSSQAGLDDENNKESACRLCRGLLDCEEAASLHRFCHFAVWGKKRNREGLDTRYGVYQDLVCRPHVLPACEAVLNLPLLDDARVGSGPELAMQVASKNLGLDKENFLTYLAWLLGERQGDAARRELPITLYGISFAGGIESQAFHSFAELEQWAAPVMSNSPRHSSNGSEPDRERFRP